MLRGIRVVECGQGVAAAFAAKLLAMLGAEVVKVEPPEGDVMRSRGPFRAGAQDPEHSGMFIYLNAGKLGVTLDLTAAEDRRRLHQLLDQSDILIHNVLPVERGSMAWKARRCARPIRISSLPRYRPLAIPVPGLTGAAMS
jgi:crotonobetainyl-CoA:carnitine CoA-transferase CaiB-like acyl-CoA transferase